MAWTAVHRLLAARAAASPDSPAVRHGARTLTYGELDARSDRAAALLAGRGAAPGGVVGVLLPRGADLVVAEAAILKTGAAYAPADPRHPVERTAQAMTRAGAALVVTTAELADGLAARGLRPVLLDEVPADPVAAPPDRTRDRDVAMIVFTSGSTGAPKGVLLEHGSLARFARWDADAFGLGPADRVALIASPGFDASAWDIWPTLAAGACLHAADEDTLLDPRALRDWLVAERITVLFLTTALAERLLTLPWPADTALRTLLTGGERLKFRPPAGLPFQVVNNYGPTETTIIATSGPVAAAGDGPPSIGAPLSIAAVHILDEDLRPVPDGEPGEIYIGGTGVARGYLADPAQTVDRFPPDPFSGRPGARMYRSGDLGRRRPDGEIEFLGRVDDQVKIRGNRVEPGEIAVVLTAHPAVTVAHVAPYTRPGDDETHLVAYVVGGPDDVGELRAYLAERLPRALIPAYFVALDALPLNANGKVDRARLPEPDARRPAASAAHTPPRTGLERRLCALWAELLHLERVGIDDSFFDLGGHSLLLVEVHRTLTEDLGHDLPLVALFEAPTIRSLSDRLEPRDAPAPAPVPASRPRGDSRALAVVGMAGRFPGAPSVAEFWANLCGGVDSIRVLAEGDGHLDVHGVLDDADRFDAAFFGCPPSEALIMDPQHRVFLECAYHALEDAGHDPARFPGTIGLFAGGATTEHLARLRAHRDRLPFVDAWQMRLGTGPDFLAARAADRLGLRGPVVSVQTACSTSLVAVHLAARAVLDGECDMALAGGATVHVPPPRGGYTPGGIISADGRLRAFDADARGAVGGSAAALVALRPLEDALADGDHVHAVLLATAIGNDGGGKVGFTAPGVDGQVRVIRAALDRAGVDPGTVTFVEAHGTGTPLGDLIEVRALTKALGPVAADAGGRALGSVKTNIGHTDAAAGVSAFIKAALAVEHGLLPPTLHFDRPNPELDLDTGRFRVTTDLTKWETGGTPRRAGVNALGIGGTNAHAILEQPPVQPPADTGRGSQLLVVSARSPEALAELSSSLAAAVSARPSGSLADIAWTLQDGRPAHPYRAFAVAGDAAAAARALTAPRPAPSGRTGEWPVVFMFPGQGGQHVGMARELYEQEPEFRRRFDRCADLALPGLGLDLREILFPPPERAADAERTLERISVGQPAVFAVEYALARLWTAWGITPAAVTGHSLGAYAAACVAGIIDLDDAVPLVVERGRLLESLPTGTMLAVQLSEDEVAPLLPPALSVAAVNGPGRTTVTGAAADVARFHEELTARGVDSKPLRIATAGHSPLVDRIRDEFEAAVRAVPLREPAVRFLSDRTGDWAAPAELTDPAYWSGHMRDPVRFSAALSRLFAEPDAVLLEVGPGRTLATLARQHPERPASRVIAQSLPHPADDASALDTALTALGRLWAEGIPVDWARVHEGERRRRVKLPLYPFQRRRFSLETSDADEPAPPPAPASAPEPRSTDAARMAEGFAVILGLDTVDRHDDFFELGGDSLIATRLAAWIRADRGVEVTAREIYGAPTPARLADLVTGRAQEETR
ncbi:type I polyketide synthase [Actinomadura atramentaria]|uniref:type I polyketide synthase n=1 Tax=Actinomadura atramentaria TaxID=1990 RepID=UPI00036CC67C|nr:type I polyketide synthase [Actinomadura atramentaria]